MKLTNASKSKHQSNHHVIVGDGIVAAELATTRNFTPGDSLTVIGPRVDHLGRGVAYAKTAADAPWRYACLLNSPSYAVDPDFAQWLQENRSAMIDRMQGRKPDWLHSGRKYIDLNDMAALNAPREIYGDFCQRRTREALNEIETHGVSIRLLATRVSQIDKSDTGLQLTTECGQRIDAHSVDVATGAPQNQRFEGEEYSGYFSELFGHEQSIADRLKPGGNVVCIGANAAMLDLLRFCQSIQPEADIQFTALSSSGQLPEPLRPSINRTQTKLELSGPYQKAEAFLQDIHRLRQEAMAKGDSFEEIRAGLRGLFMQTSLTSFLPDVSEARKVAKPLYRRFQGGTRDSIDDFNRLKQSGNTQILAGRMLRVSHSDNNAAVIYEDHKGHSQSINARVIVNCAGPGPNASFDPLTNNMIDQNLISLCPESGGIVVGTDCHTGMKGLRYLGPAITTIGNTPEPVPYYDALRLRKLVQRINA